MPQATLLTTAALDQIIANLTDASKTVLSGTSNPASGLGKNGDFYINTATSTIFGPKTAGAWGLGTSLIGPQGATGSTGATGATGATGNNGWAPVFANVADGSRIVQQVIDWTGGQGTKPTAGQYVSASGLTSNITNAVDIKGATGATGAAGATGQTGSPGVSTVTFLGNWNASTNSPALTTTPSAQNGYYIVSVAGTQSITGASTAFAVGDRVISNGTAWVRVLPDDMSKLTPTSFSTPPANTTLQTINDLTGFTGGTNLGVLGRTYININSYGAATSGGYVSRFRVNLTNAEVGRIVRFYILTPVASNYLVKYDSGNVAAELAGLNSFSPALGAAPINIGDVIGCYVLPLATANAWNVNQSGGNTIGNSVYVAGPLTLGSSYAGTAESNTRLIPIEATIVDRDLVVGRYWANKPNGYLQLDSNGLIPNGLTANPTVNQIPQLPLSKLPNPLQDVSPSAPNTILNHYLVSKGASAIISANGGMSNYAHLPNGGSDGIGNSTFTTDKVIVNWVSTSAGFASGGMLTEVRIGPLLDTVAGATIQAWIVRPTTALTGSSVSFSLVQAIGTIDASVAGRWHVFRGLAIVVQAGDMIAFRPQGVNAPFRSGSGGQTDYRNIRATVADTSINALNSGLTGSTTNENSRQWYVEADIVTGSVLAQNSPRSNLRLDSLGFIPDAIGRSFDLPWKGKKIVAVGTSITAATQGYIYWAGLALQCIMDNQGVGSSGIVYTSTGRALSLSGTQAQLTADYGAPYASQSYEVKVLGKNADLYIFDHAYNDGWATLGTINSTDKSTFYGAYNVIIQALLAEKPTAQFMFITPVSLYNPTNTTGGNPNAGTVEKRNALFALADKYKAPILDFTQTLQLSASQAATFLTDTVHPNAELHIRAGRQLYQFITGL